MGKSYGIIAIKGGVGKTTAVVNLGTALAAQGKHVLLVDANFSAANLGLHLGLVNPDTTIQDVLAGKRSVEAALHQHEAGFHLLPASVVPKKVDYLKLKEVLRPLKASYDFMLIDSSPALNEEILATMMAADELLVVSSPDYPTLSCTMHAIKVAKRRNIPITGLLLNRVYGKPFELTLEEIEQATGVPVIAVLPENYRVAQALAATTPVAKHHPRIEVAIEYHKLAAALAGTAYKDPRFFARLKALARWDVPRHEVNRSLLGKGVN